MSIIVAIPLLATCGGVIAWGILFERFYEMSWFIALAAALTSGLIILTMGRYFKEAR